jgi:DNA polymerase-4
MMPLYSFPHRKDLNYKVEEHVDRYFIHLDIDAFFAQVEQRDNPKLRGRPVSIGGNGGNKGICMTASYEARACGVDIGMSVVEARKLCPGLISIPCYGQKYEAILLNIMDNIKKLIPEDCIEQYSIDECFLEITPVVKDYFSAIALAAKIKKIIKRIENLTASIGLSFNKSYAKLATKFDKPNGLYVIRQDEREKIFKLPVSKIWGVGSRIERRMALLNIVTIGDLANANIHALHKEFGINGVIFRKLARGEDTSSISTMKERIEKSFNHNHTLTDSIYKHHEISQEIKRMVEYICRKMRAKDLIADHMSFVIRYDDLGYVGNKVRLAPPSNLQNDLYRAAMHIYSKFPPPTIKRKARLFGVSVFQLYKVYGYNLDLFDSSNLIPYKQIDFLKEKYGEKIIRQGIDRT